MIIDFISLIFIVLLNVVLIVSIFNFTRANTKDNTRNALIIDVSELISLLVVVLLCVNKILNNIMDGPSLLFIMILSFVLIVLFWSISRVPMVRKFLGIKEGVVFQDTPRLLNNNKSNNQNKKSENKDAIKSSKNNDCGVKLPSSNNVVFSKYIRLAEENDFKFEELLHDYDKDAVEFELTKQMPKDYSAYNGYPEDHICHGCGCVKHEDGYKFCGKFIPGMGMIGCSERWGCLNCKKCDQASNTSNRDYDCDNCKCHKTNAGYICGKIDRTNGYVHKCKSECPKCDQCYGGDSSDLLGNAGLLTVNPSTSLNKIIRYDLETSNLDGFL